MDKNFKTNNSEKRVSLDVVNIALAKMASTPSLRFLTFFVCELFLPWNLIVCVGEIPCKCNS